MVKLGAELTALGHPISFTSSFLRTCSWQLVVLLATCLSVETSAQSPGFLLISAPRNGKISWVKLPEDGSFEGVRPTTLVKQGLRSPQGLAVDQKRQLLYVSDPDEQKIFCYQLVIHPNSIYVNSDQMTVAHNVESRWVAVDGTGNVFFSDEPQNQILKVPAGRLGTESTPEVVYSGSDMTEVSLPGGVAVDNFHVFWTNKNFGKQAGSVVKGSEFRATPEIASQGVSVLARNTAKSYGICLALGNVYYTDSNQKLYGVKKNGGPPAEISSRLNKPRGCAWDGDGTVYVADRGANAVYSFAGNMHVLGGTQLHKAFAMEDAFGLALAATCDAAFRQASPMNLLAVAIILVVMSSRPTR